MSMLKDSSELQEALNLFRSLLDEQDPGAAPAHGPRAVIGRDLEPGIAEGPAVTTPLGDPFPVQPPPTCAAGALAAVPRAASSRTAIEPVEGEFRGDRLENVLIAMCRRGGFSGAVVSDASGLPLAVFNSPVEVDRVAAFTSIMGDALDKAGRFLGQHGADYISMDISYGDKAVVRRFSIAEVDLYLMVLCAQSADERSELEVSIQQITSILG